MSLKFEVKDWRFEITWRELSATPLARREASRKVERRDGLGWQPALVNALPNTPNTHLKKRSKETK